MASISIIGVSGSGKTVLVTSLAKFLGNPENPTGAFMEPLSIETQRYVERASSSLGGGSWPPSTPPGVLMNLRWNILWPSRRKEELRILDAAGQDMRRLFGGEAVTNLAVLPEQLRHIVTAVAASQIVLLVVNLGDFIGETDPDRLLENQWTIKFAIDWLDSLDGDRTYALVFTQMDLYQAEVERHGGSLQAIAAKYLPFVHGPHVDSGGVPLFGVSCVSKTVTAVGSDGVVRRVPAPTFEPLGLRELTFWLNDVTPASQPVPDSRPASQPASFPAQGLHTWWPQIERWAKEYGALAFWLTIGCVFTLANLYSCFRAKPPARPMPPAVRWHVGRVSGMFHDDVILHNDSDSIMTHLRLRLSIPGHAPVYLETPFIDAGSAYKWPNALDSAPENANATSALSCDQSRTAL